MSKKPKFPSYGQFINNFFNFDNEANPSDNYRKNIVKPKNGNLKLSNINDPPKVQKKINKTTQKMPEQIINHNDKSVFDGFLGKKKSSEEHNENLLNREIKRNHVLNRKNEYKIKKKINKSGFNEDYMSYLMGINIGKNNMEKTINLKEEDEQKQIYINKKLRNLMGVKERKFMTQNEENEEQLKKEEEINKNILCKEQKIPIPFINSIFQNSLDKNKPFLPSINDIYKKVLDFDFYRTNEEIQNSFEKKEQSKYACFADFFDELKYYLLNEKIDNSELQNYEDADIKFNIKKIKDINGSLSLYKMCTKRKLFKEKLLGDNDIIAIYNEKATFAQKQITLKNENSLNYFLGIIKHDTYSNDLNLFVLKKSYEIYIENYSIKQDKRYLNMFDKKIKYLGNIDSILKKYKVSMDRTVKYEQK